MGLHEKNSWSLRGDFGPARNSLYISARLSPSLKGGDFRPRKAIHSASKHSSDGGFLPVFAQNEVVFGFLGQFIQLIAKLTFIVGLVLLIVVIEKLRRKHRVPFLGVGRIYKVEGGQELG